MTCIVCKVFESIISDHLITYFKQSNLFSNKQNGFIHGRSTQIQLLKIIDSWINSIDEGNKIKVIYTDFEKAFDKAPHKRLIFKLKQYGMHPLYINWIKQYLNYRKQRVKINNEYSEWQNVTSGIPQGSVLGPLLFVIYINDIPEACNKYCDIYLFADDAKISKIIKNKNDIENLQKGCNALEKWINLWLVSLNVDKCLAMFINKDNNENNNNYTIKGKNLIHLNSTKDLGIIVHNKLNFHDNIYKKIKNSYQMLGILNRNFKHMSVKTWTTLYKSFVRSHLEYGVCV